MLTKSSWENDDIRGNNCKNYVTIRTKSTKMIVNSSKAAEVFPRCSLVLSLSLSIELFDFRLKKKKISLWWSGFISVQLNLLWGDPLWGHWSLCRRVGGVIGELQHLLDHADAITLQSIVRRWWHSWLLLPSFRYSSYRKILHKVP